MDVIPLVGIGSIRFGDSIESVTESIGLPKETREHPDPTVSFSLTYDGLHFGFDSSRSLSFIVVTDGKVGPILWGDNPFEIANSASDAFEAIRDWLTKSNRLNEISSNSFGGSISVPDQQVIFCFPLPDWNYLEGVQLYPQPQAEQGSDGKPDTAAS